MPAESLVNKFPPRGLQPAAGHILKQLHLQKHSHPSHVKQKSRPVTGGLVKWPRAQAFAPLPAARVLRVAFLRFRYASRRRRFWILLLCCPISILYIRGLFRLCSATMDFDRKRFNTNLLATLVVPLVMLLCGCQSTKPKSMPAVLRVHPEATENTTFTKTVNIFQNKSVTMKIDQSPLLTEADVQRAAVVEALGGFALYIKFNPRGQWLLDQHSSLHRGKHLAIFVEFGEKNGKSRWIAAPILSHRISDGTLLFTPDATREETEEMAANLGEKEPKDKIKSEAK
jgi:hypothetical protein